MPDPNPLPWYKDRAMISNLVTLLIAILSAIGAWLGQNAATDAKYSAQSANANAEAAHVRSAENGAQIKEVHKEIKAARAMGKD